MPKIADIQSRRDRPPKLDTIVGWSGDTPWITTDTRKINPDELVGRKGILIYDKMMEDEQVKAVVRFKRDAITSRGFYFAFDDSTELSRAEQQRRIALFERCVDSMQGAFSDSLNAVLGSMYHGYSLTEKVFGEIEFEGRPYIGLRALIARPINTFWFETDEYGRVLALWQEINAKKQRLRLENFIHHVQNPEVDEHYGRSELREAYRAWYAKDTVIKFWLRFIERLAGGFVTGTRTDDSAPQFGSQEYTDLQNALNNIQNITSIIAPPGIELEVHQPQKTDQYEKAIEQFNLAIAKSLLVPNLLGVSETGQTGSYSQSSTQLEGFLWTLNADSLRLEDTLNEQLWRPLSRINFADGMGPTFRFKPLSQELTRKVIESWRELVAAKMVTHSDDDEDMIRKLLNMPARSEEATAERDKQRAEAQKRLKAQPDPPDPDDPDNSGSSDDDVTDPGAAKFSLRGSDGEVVYLSAKSLARVEFAVIDEQMTTIETQSVAGLADATARVLSDVAGKVDVAELRDDPELIASVTVQGPARGKLKNAIRQTIMDGWRLGKRHATDEVSKARGAWEPVEMRRIEDISAEYFEANSFRLAGNLSDLMRDIIQASLMNAVKFDWTSAQTIEDIYTRAVSRGIVTKEAMAKLSDNALAAKILQIDKDVNAAAVLERMVRTNVAESINEARYSFFTDPSLGEFVVALEYSAILDQRTTEICSHLDSRVYSDASEIWNKYRPPNHWNCRSLLVAVTQADEWDGTESEPPTLQPAEGFGGSA